MSERVICIVGPTATGKSELAEDVALSLDGEIVSVDSMQVYRGMDIGTAKVPFEQRRCPLHMVDLVDVCDDYSVACFQQDARRCIDTLVAEQRTPVLCGGTGLYLDAVIDEMSFPKGETSGASRSPYEELARDKGPQALHELLKERDPQSAEIIHPNNVRRVVRALEMLDQGTSYATHHEGLLKRDAHYDARIWALVYPRETLYERINRRVDAMFRQGLVDEVHTLLGEGLLNSATARQAIGYKEVIAYIGGEIDLPTAQELVKRNTRRFAKRQLSWLKRDGRARYVDLSKIDKREALEAICDDWRTS